ncbi:MAG: hypothetical protein Kow0059_19810 [Candidatus Sumerlaeia bacterium]
MMRNREKRSDVLPTLPWIVRRVMTGWLIGTLFGALPLPAPALEVARSDGGTSPALAQDLRRTHDPADWLDFIVVTNDKVILRATYCPPRNPQTGLVVVLHPMLGRTRETWHVFCHRLIDAGYGFCIYDARGHGASVHRVGAPDSVDYRTFAARGEDNEWNRLSADMGEVVDYLCAVHHLKHGRIIAGGASIGANAAIRYAASHPDIGGVLALSPGLNYHDVKTDVAMKTLGAKGVPVFVAAAERDRDSFESTRTLVQIYQDAARAGAGVVHRYQDGGAHGTEMLGGPLDEAMLEWLKTRAASIPAAASVP